MKLKLPIVLIGILLGANLTFAITYPKEEGFVNDFTGKLTNGEKANIEALLVNFEKQTSNEIVVAVISSFEGLDPFTYSQNLFTEWKIGKEDKKNGILFLLGPRPDLPFPQRGHIFINVGKGLEGALPDSLAGTIARNEVVPHLKNKDLATGILKGVLAIMEATKGEYKAQPVKESPSWGNIAPFLVMAGYFFLVYLAAFLGRSQSWWQGGVIGVAGGGVIGLIFFSGIMILVSIVGLGAAGLIFDYIVSKNYKYRKAHGLSTSFFGSRGGFWSGGHGGGFGGGGFGGFGGGSSGGGGAGASW